MEILLADCHLAPRLQAALGSACAGALSPDPRSAEVLADTRNRSHRDRIDTKHLVLGGKCGFTSGVV